MSPRERYIATFSYQPVDRPFLAEWGPWAATLERWKSEGMEGDWPPELGECDPIWHVPVNFGPIPPFEREVISEDERTIVYVDERGITRREFKDHPETSMPSFVDFPLKSRRDWEEKLAWRYDPDTPERFPENWDELVERWKRRDVPLIVTAYPFLGMFGPLRDMMGLERISMLLYDDPKFIRDLAAHWGEFCYRILERIVSQVEVDAVYFWEDMAFHSAPLISPRMFMEFFGEHYRRINNMLQEAGVRFRFVDSDGNIYQLIEPFMECGINGVYPLEAAAGMDVRVLRKRWGRELRMMGNIDKRAIAAGPPAIDEELEAKIPLALEGGFIPHCDHSMPPDISYQNFRYYWRRKKELLGIS